MNKNPKKRFEVLLILFIISVFGLGCIGEALTNYNLKYNFDTGDIFVYNCTYLTEKTKDTVPIRIEMLISDFDGNNITSNVTSTKIIDGNNTESSYTTVMDVYGNLITYIRQVNVIRDIYFHISLPLDSISSSESPPYSIFLTSFFLFSEK